MTTPRGPRQAQWNISARQGDMGPALAWANRCARLGLVSGNRGVMPAIRLALQLTGEFTDDQLLFLLDKTPRGRK